MGVVDNGMPDTPSRALRLVMSRIEADEFVSELSAEVGSEVAKVSRLQAPITTLPAMAGSGNFALIRLLAINKRSFVAASSHKCHPTAHRRGDRPYSLPH